MQIKIHTSCMENYGFDDGEDVWKNKGGELYIIDVDTAELLCQQDRAQYLKNIVTQFHIGLTRNFDFVESVVDWELTDG